MSNSSVIKAAKRFEQDPDLPLVAEAQKGDMHAFQQLYDRHHRRIYGLCWRMLADKDSAEDVCQEVFVQLWHKVGNFRGESKFSTWLHSVATNVVLGHVRQQKNWIQRVFSIEEKTVEQTVELDNDDNISALDRHIQRLPERARLVFVLFAVEGYRHEEIGKMLNMAVGSSKAQYHRAKTLLKQSLAEEAS